jgi:hypothetical protein
MATTSNTRHARQSATPFGLRRGELGGGVALSAA